jgi:hypothetical protein
MSQKVGRETLYDEVWTDPVTEVAKRYGLSDVGLAKLCRTMGIPLPTRGYWAKLRAGTNPGRTPLPVHGRYRQTASLTRFGPDAVREREEVKRRVRQARQVIEVPVGPIDRHPLVAAAGKRLAKGDVKSEKGLVSAPAEILHVEVTRGSLDRALDLFNALIFEFAKRGSTVEVEAEKKRTVLMIEGTQVELSLSERVRRKEHVDTPEETKAKERYWKLPHYAGREYPGTPRYDYLATGILTLKAGRCPSRSWNDTERTPLERRFPEVVSGLILLASEIRAREEEQAREAERRRLAKENYARIMEQRKRERGLFEDLEAKAKKWKRATRLRAYVDAVEQTATLKGELTDELLDWIGWARAKADWLDPMIRVSDLILDAPEPEKPAFWW